MRLRPFACASSEELLCPSQGGAAVAVARASPNPEHDDVFVTIDNQIKYLRHGRVRHVGTVEIYESHNRTDTISVISAEALRTFIPGPYLPRRWSSTEWVEGNARDYMDMRELMVSVASGRGLEIGAGPHAIRVPLDCAVTYVDNFEVEEQIERMWPGYDVRAVMPTDVKDSFQHLAAFPPNSQDFIMASHVIEHLPNPILAIEKSYERLKRGGWLFLIAPDKRYTFDLGRPETPIEHLLEDYRNPDRSRDLDHYMEYYRFAAQDPGYEKKARKEFEAGRDIHYHVWTVETFYWMIKELRRLGIVPWSEVWWRPRVTGQSDAMEFYFALQK